MEFITDKGIRIVHNHNEKIVLDAFIAESGNLTTVVFNDIFIEFKDNKYLDTYTLPF